MFEFIIGFIVGHITGTCDCRGGSYGRPRDEKRVAQIEAEKRERHEKRHDPTTDEERER